MRCLLLLIAIFSCGSCAYAQEQSKNLPEPELGWIQVSEDGRKFVNSKSSRSVELWGVNYDHDGDGQLLEDYWSKHWPTVEADFREIKALGANVVRIHLQISRFMDSPKKANTTALTQLKQLVGLAESNRLYLDITGLGCYHKQDVPDWYDKLSEPDRWDTQACFWMAVADVCKQSPAVFCYDLMNEPILPGKKVETEWLTGELGGKHFVQRISLDLAGRSRHDVARAWVAKLTGAIRSVDKRHLITVGVIPWAMVFKKAKPIFYAPGILEKLDFVSIHVYPQTGKVDEALAVVEIFQLGKPVVVEEIFPLKASLEETDKFIQQARPNVAGWISFYWGKSVDEYREQGDIQGAIVASWLEYFQKNSPNRR